MAAPAAAEGAVPAAIPVGDVLQSLIAQGFTVTGPSSTNRPLLSIPTKVEPIGIPFSSDYKHFPHMGLRNVDRNNRAKSDKQFFIVEFPSETWFENLSGNRPGNKGDEKALLEACFGSTVGLHVFSSLEYITSLYEEAQDDSVTASDFRDTCLQSIPALMSTLSAVNDAIIERVGLLRLLAIESDSFVREAARNKFMASIHALPDVGAPGMNAVLSDLTLMMDSAKMKAAIKYAASKAVSSPHGGGYRNNGDSSTRRQPRTEPGRGGRGGSSTNAHQTAKSSGAAVGESSAARK